MSEIAVLFVCTGNICRSPTAEGVARKLLVEAGIGAQVMVDSAGLEGWHAGDPPDPRAIASAAERGYDLTPQRSRRFDPSDFERFALILGMGQNHVSALRASASGDTASRVRLFLDFLPPSDPKFGCDVPDPYYGDQSDYELSLDLIEYATPEVIQVLKRDFL